MLAGRHIVIHEMSRSMSSRSSVRGTVERGEGGCRIEGEFWTVRQEGAKREKAAPRSRTGVISTVVALNLQYISLSYLVHTRYTLVTEKKTKTRQSRRARAVFPQRSARPISSLRFRAEHAAERVAAREYPINVLCAFPPPPPPQQRSKKASVERHSTAREAGR